MKAFFDAHNHLHDPRLDGVRESAIASLASQGLGAAVVNGTSESDWPLVAALAKRVPWVIPSFGLHPWMVPARTPAWRETLLGFLDKVPGAAIGEIGLDRWIGGYDIAEQTECFEWQLTLAAERNLPVSIHCIQAWGALWDSLKRCRLPARGFLIHAYGGSAEMLPGFVRLGAYFSFSPYFLHPRKAAQREAFAAMPKDRILVETDAPDLAPPAERNPNPLPGGLNHPANILLSYEGLAEVRGIPLEELAAQVAENFRRWTATSFPSACE